MATEMNKNDENIDKAIQEVRNAAGENADVGDYKKIYNEMLKNGTLNNILSGSTDSNAEEDQSSEELKLPEEVSLTKHGFQNIVYARLVLDEDKYDAIGKENLIKIGMSEEKIDALQRMDVEYIIAIGGENLAKESMTIGKITYLSYQVDGGIDEIKAIGGKIIADPKINEIKLMNILQKYSLEEIIKIGGEKLLNISLTKILFSKDQYKALGVNNKDFEESIDDKLVSKIAKTFGAKMIEAIGVKNLLDPRMNFHLIDGISKKYTNNIKKMKKIGIEKIFDMPLAKMILSTSQFKAFWDDSLEGMYINPRHLNCIRNNLSIKQIGEIGGKWLTIEGMTQKKIKVIKKLSIDQIKAIGGHILANQYITEKIIELLVLYDSKEIEKVGGENLVGKTIDELKVMFNLK